MITIRQFVGTLLEELTKSRVKSDIASVEIAKKYLAHPFLKGFPIPRMLFREVEIELTFGVMTTSPVVSVFEDEEARKSMRHQLRRFLEHLPSKSELSDHFVNDAELCRRWKEGLPALDARFEKALIRKDLDSAGAARVIALVIHNYFHETLAERPGHGLMAQFRPVPQTAEQEEAAPNLEEFLLSEIGRIVKSVYSLGDREHSEDDPLDIKVLVGVDELENVPASSLQKMKVHFRSADLKWVMTDSGGEKIATLTRDTT